MKEPTSSHQKHGLRVATITTITAVLVLAVLGADDLARWGNDLPPGPIFDRVVQLTEAWRDIAAPLGGHSLSLSVHYSLEWLKNQPSVFASSAP